MPQTLQGPCIRVWGELDFAVPSVHAGVIERLVDQGELLKVLPGYELGDPRPDFVGSGRCSSAAGAELSKHLTILGK
jgi:hypothetical protein